MSCATAHRIHAAWRRWLAAAGALLLVAGTVYAAPPVVEVVAYGHQPVQSALKPLRDWLTKQGTKTKVIEIDMETPAGERRLQSVGLKGHLPILVLIDGQYRFARTDGSSVNFTGFPAGPETPAAAKGTWSVADVEVVLNARP